MSLLTSAAGPARLLVFYAVGLILSVALFGALVWVGEQAFGTTSTAPQSGVPEHIDTMLHVLLALAVVIVTARVVGAAFRFLHQPAVIGEVVGGILLGPSFLGFLSPATYAFLLPEQAAPFLGVISQLGVILYMFLVGLHLDLRILRTSGHATLAISHASIVVPFLFGGVLALGLYSGFAGEAATFTSFALFLGVAMAVTAFPVLARILGDNGLQRTEMGMLALTCAAVDDVTAWCLLAIVVSMTQATLAGAFTTLGLTVIYIAAMFIVVRPLVARALPWLEAFDRLSEGGLAVVIVGLLLSALATEFVGIHAIFGAFLLGAITPHTSRVATDMTERLEGLVRVLFLPAFFAFTGMRTEVGLLTGWHDWLLCALIVLVATAGKFGGTVAAARLVGLGRRDAAALGILMNTRGLVELIVLNIGLDLGVISPRLFTMLVLMALVTTFMTSPILSWLLRNRPWPVLGDARATSRAYAADSGRRTQSPAM